MKQVFALLALMLVALVASVQATQAPGVGQSTLEGTISAYRTNQDGEVISFTFSGKDDGTPPTIFKDKEISVNAANGNDATIIRAKENGATVVFTAEWTGSGSKKEYELDGGIRVK